MSFMSKIKGIIGSVFQLGIGGPKIKDNSGAVEMKNAADSAFVITRGLPPVGDNDYVTKKHFEDNNAAAVGLAYATLPLALATKVSTGILPDDCTIRDVVVKVVTAYDASATFDGKRTGDATKVLFDTTDVDWGTIGEYHVPHYTDWGSTGAGTLTSTLVNSPTVGAAEVLVGYVTPRDIT